MASNSCIHIGFGNNALLRQELLVKSNRQILAKQIVPSPSTGWGQVLRDLCGISLLTRRLRAGLFSIASAGPGSRRLDLVAPPKRCVTQQRACTVIVAMVLSLSFVGSTVAQDSQQDKDADKTGVPAPKKHPKT